MEARMSDFRDAQSVSLEPGEDGAKSSVLVTPWLEVVSSPVVVETASLNFLIFDAILQLC